MEVQTFTEILGADYYAGVPDSQLKALCDYLMRTYGIDPVHHVEAIGKLGENHVYFLPYLMGERSPHNNPNARGTFIGMTMDTTRADMTQAVLEGVAFALRDSFEVAKSLGIRIERTKICGGGAKSPLWKKIIANVMNIKVDVIESEEGPALGGAMLAAVACGEYESVEAAAEKLVKVVDTVEPTPEIAAKYEERYQQFKEIYPACKPLFEIIK